MKKHNTLMYRMLSFAAAFSAALLLVAVSGTARAVDDTAATKAELEELRKEVREAKEWRHTDSMAHLAGYAAVNYTAPENGTGTFNGTTFNPIFHYAYKDWLLLDSELEIALKDNGESEFTFEYMTVDLVLNDSMVLLAGKFLSPIGMFRRNLHPAWVNKLPSAPVGFNHGQAVPLADVGVQLAGGIPLGAMRANYAIYTGNGPMLELNAAGTEIEQIGTEGLGADNNGNKSVGGRFGLLPIPRLEIAVSFATAKASDDMGMTGKRDYDVTGADFSWQVAGFDLRGEYAKTKLGEDTVSMVDPAAKTWKAWYAQGAWRIPGTNWEPVLRYGKYERPRSTVVATKQWAPGINYLFASHVIAKLAYEFNKTEGVQDDDRLLLQLAYGF
ncbi:MAG: hypothetical protein A3A87_02995 [Candidatus Muproteobacteria bacterium RIFCSPLOWO2_01_FULL_60_18]|uniref:Porin n=1 Tax=Candidatus Muproteobacteria bacterium RIFCSPLOWO2_01_FULL_60_18 TaxID=1817768 RepID=A0A1F6U265_9PROT|nr:MAG: hypothetical protein A3A87_02995 [Candidatus Muproteobacteria bacterium RIFCSPLOWO2_01_FULL_60_18]OGI52374.1 MAG: hypothetical protein A2W42_04835 [Candidatus Muproteobacteria bacterium RIFCSPHIGHO2_01_60_12]